MQASAIQLQTEDASVSTSLENKLVNDLPLVVSGTVRTPFDLASLTPDAKNLGGDNGFSVGGGQAASYGTSLDGVSTNTSRALSKSWVASNSPSVEAIEQFTVDTNGYKAEYGHAGGGNLTYVSKSGTNQFHGSAYEFLRNNDFDANNLFSNRSGIAELDLQAERFWRHGRRSGLDPQGLSRQETRRSSFSRTKASATGPARTAPLFTVPTPEMYNGDFSKWVTSAGAQIPIYNPLSQVQNAGRHLHAPGLSRQRRFPRACSARRRMKALGVFQSSGTLAPNNGAAPGTVGLCDQQLPGDSGTQIYPVNKYSIKGDHIFNDKHRISGYYGHDREHQTAGSRRTAHASRPLHQLQRPGAGDRRDPL